MLQIGANIKLVRTSLRLKQQGFADKLGIGLSSLKKYETNVSPVPPFELQLIAKLAGISVKDLTEKELTVDDIPAAAQLVQKVTNVPRVTQEKPATNAGKESLGEDYKGKYLEILEKYTNLLEQINSTSAPAALQRLEDHATQTNQSIDNIRRVLEKMGEAVVENRNSLIAAQKPKARSVDGKGKKTRS